MTGGVVNKLVDTLSKKGVNHEGISMIEDHIGRNVSLARSKYKRFTVPSTSVLFMAPEANWHIQTSKFKFDPVYRGQYTIYLDSLTDCEGCVVSFNVI